LVGLGIFLLVGLVIFIFYALKVMPKATITIHTTSTPVSANFQLKTSDTAKALDEENGVIPAQLKTTDQSSSQQVQATGQQNNGEKATGSVTITNCSNNSVVVPAGSGVSTGGLTFITQKTLSLDSGNFTSGGSCKSSGTHVGSTSVVAQQPGEKYNVGSGQTFVVSGQTSDVKGANGSAFSGGTDNIVTVVSQQDIDKAKSKITSQDTDSFTKTFEKQLSDQGFYILTPTLKNSEPATTASPDVGQPASSINVSIKITYTVLAIKKDDLSKAIADKLTQQVDKTKQKLENDDPLAGADVSVQDQQSPSKVTLAIHEDTKAVPIIDVNSVKKQVGGMKAGQIQSLLTPIPGVKSVDVKMGPFWVSKAPKNPSKITVKLQPLNKSE
jgi:hypothetical protein